MDIRIDSSKLSPQQEYVCWIDIMGTKNTMSESFEKAVNFILRLHECVINAVKSQPNVNSYPLMDGVFITCPNKETICKIIDEVFTEIADHFISVNKNIYRFIIKGSLSYGFIAHGNSISNTVCSGIIADNDEYKKSIMFGMPMIQAFTAEHTAPPFGIYIHESARQPKRIQGRYYHWKIKQDKTFTKDLLKQKIISYFNWCTHYSPSLEMDTTKISMYKKLSEEFLTDRKANDNDNFWDAK